MEALVQACEINISYNPRATNDKPVITNANTASIALQPWFPLDTIAAYEQAVVMFLNNGNQVIGAYRLSSGGICQTVMDIRILFAVALKSLAVGIILAHNHPSGSLKPSKQDLELTRRVKETGELMAIKLIDHIILTPDNGYLSLKDEGVI